MNMNEQMLLSGVATYFDEPVLGMDGEWGTAAGMAVRESLSRGSLDGVMDVLVGMDGRGVANVLGEVGFAVQESAVERGRDAVLAGVQMDLIEAVNRRVDGFELRSDRAAEQSADFAAKDVADGFQGNRGALRDIQRVFSASGVSVDLLGDAQLQERSSLLCVAGQAMQAGVQGFGFDGLPGKFVVPGSLQEVVSLHQAAAAEVAVETVRESVDVWRSGKKVGEMSRWVPDSIQRVLQGSLSEDSAHTLNRAVDGGMIAKFAAEAGLHAVTQTLAEQGLDVNAPTIEQQADALGLALVTPDRQHGKYAGPVVGIDHRAGLLKFARAAGIEVPFTSLADGQARLQLGDTARVDFKKGAVVVSVAERDSRGVGR